MRTRRFAGALLWAWMVAAYAQQVKTVEYRDAANGASFAYPAEWRADPGLGFYMQDDILEPTAVGRVAEQAIMKVGFENRGTGPYAGTNLDGVEFVYFVVPGGSRAACEGRVRREQDTSQGDRAPAGVVIGGVTYLHLRTGDAGLGHDAYHDLYGGYLADRCYLFEGVVHTIAAQAHTSDPTPLTGVQQKALRAQLEAVMRSVRIAPPSR